MGGREQNILLRPSTQLGRKTIAEVRSQIAEVETSAKMMDRAKCFYFCNLTSYF
jgi:hypothetical protein